MRRRGESLLFGAEMKFSLEITDLNISALNRVTPDWPRPSWGSRKARPRMISRLSQLSGRDFQRALMPLMRILRAGATECPDLKFLDKAGIDYVIWNDDLRFPFALQAKGFEVPVQELGTKQVKACEESFAALSRHESIQIEDYWLVYNRDSRNETFRSGVMESVRKLLATGQVKKFRLVSLADFLDACLNALLIRFLLSIRNRQKTLAENLETPYDCHLDPLLLSNIPFVTSIITYDQHKMIRQTRGNSKQIGCTDEALCNLIGKSERVLVLGDYGTGKTTCIKKYLLDSQIPSIALSASGIPRQINSTKSFLLWILSAGEILTDIDVGDFPEFEIAISEVALYTFETNAAQVLLIIDALDESPVLMRSGGIQAFFNWVREIRIPVIVTCRTSVWRSRTETFKVGFGLIGRRTSDRTNLGLLELMPWDDGFILDLLDRYYEQAGNPVQQENLLRLRNEIIANGYDRLFGTVPRNPLFLHMLFELVQEHGEINSPTGRVVLITEFIRMKLKRDFLNPIHTGGQPRLTIRNEADLETAMSDAWRLMLAAAAAMVVELDENHLELSADCPLESAAMAAGFDRHIDSTTVYLNTLLAPVKRQTVFDREIRIKFTHRVFQDYFTAVHEIEDRSGGGYIWPREVEDWIIALNANTLWRDPGEEI